MERKPFLLHGGASVLALLAGVPSSTAQTTSDGPAEVVDETTVAADLVTQLKYDRYTHKDPVPDWRPAKPFAAMVGALLLQELEDASDGWLHRTPGASP